MTINEISFFRDMQPFDALRDTIIPELLKLRSQRKLTIWSAAWKPTAWLSPCGRTFRDC